MPKGYKGAYTATRKMKLGKMGKSKVVSRLIMKGASRKGMS